MGPVTHRNKDIICVHLWITNFGVQCVENFLALETNASLTSLKDVGYNTE